MYTSRPLSVLLLLAAVAVAASRVYDEDFTPNGRPSLDQRVDRLERLVLQQQEQLQAEKLKTEHMKKVFEAKQSQWEREVDEVRHKNSVLEGEMATLKSQWAEKQKQWEAEKQALRHDLDVVTMKLREKLTEESSVSPHVHILSDENVPLNSARTPNTADGAEASATGDRPARADDTDPLAHVVSQMSQRMTEMSAEIHVLQTAVQEAGSSVYVHWGSSTCPASNSLVYSGIMGGSARDEHVANYLCLTMSPVLSNHVLPDYGAHLYGSEYQTYDSHASKDALCAVCETPRSNTVMIPGTSVCEAGWTKEYSGFLMADYADRHVATEYICVDSRLEGSPSSTAHQEGKMLFLTVTQCGTLPCDPYVNNKVVTCVVCSK